MNTPMSLETEHLNSHGTCWQNMEEGSFTGDFERKVRFCFIRRSLSFFWGGGGSKQCVKEGPSKRHLPP